MRKVQSIVRKLGHQLIFPDTSVPGLLFNKIQIIKSLQQHGCICIKNVKYTQKEMIQFTKGIWNHVIQLPKFLCFNNQAQEFKQIARVGNVQLDGTLKDSQKQAAYWHQDGNFWGEQKKHIFNALHTRQQPDVGGDTHVMDLVDGANFLKKKRPEIYKKLQQHYGILNIEQINDFKLYNAKNTLSIQSITKHALLVEDPIVGQRLFLSVHKLLNKKTNQQSDLKIGQVTGIIEKEMGFYAHKWQKGDLLIWDNLQVMHRSSGSFSGRRLLFRTQGRF